MRLEWRRKRILNLKPGGKTKKRKKRTTDAEQVEGKKRRKCEQRNLSIEEVT